MLKEIISGQSIFVLPSANFEFLKTALTGRTPRWDELETGFVSQFLTE